MLPTAFVESRKPNNSGPVVDVRSVEVNAAARAALANFQHELAKLPPFELTVKHYFADGLYVRELFIPAGVALVGYTHVEDCVSMLAGGVLAINDGTGVRVLRAPMTVAVPAGSKKAGYAIEDAVFVDCYANPDNERDIDVLHARLFVDTREEFAARLENKQ